MFIVTDVANRCYISVIDKGKEYKVWSTSTLDEKIMSGNDIIEALGNGVVFQNVTKFYEGDLWHMCGILWRDTFINFDNKECCIWYQKGVFDIYAGGVRYCMVGVKCDSFSIESDCIRLGFTMNNGHSYGVCWFPFRNAPNVLVYGNGCIRGTSCSKADFMRKFVMS